MKTASVVTYGTNTSATFTMTDGVEDQVASFNLNGVTYLEMPTDFVKLLMQYCQIYNL